MICVNSDYTEDEDVYGPYGSIVSSTWEMDGDSATRDAPRNRYRFPVFLLVVPNNYRTVIPSSESRLLGPLGKAE